MRSAVRCRRAGLSLIELLVVIAIMATAAGMVASWSDSLDSRSRQEETTRRLAEIRSAIVGPDAVSADGDLLSGGYVQDTGWLPDSGADLLSCPEIAAGVPMPKLYYDSLWRTWTGWRGPYLAAPPLRRSAGSTPALYDGYGNDFYGWFAESGAQRSWRVPRLSGVLAVRSLGADGVKDSAGGKSGVYERDWPLAEQPLLGESDWVTDLRGLQVEVTNRTGVDYSASPVSVRLRIIVPRWEHAENPLGYWPVDRDNDEFIGQAITLDVAAGGDATGRNQKVYDFTAVGRSIRVPHGRRMLFLVRDADGLPLPGVRAYAELAVSRRVSPAACVKLKIRN